MAEPLIVTPAEAGQKLLSFLARRFDVPQNVFHRWIRTGQVRINGGRVKPFDRVVAGDAVRVPPFAVSERGGAEASGGSQGHAGAFSRSSNATDAKGAASKPSQKPSLTPKNLGLPPILSETEELLVLAKPSGLPIHGGTGHTDSLAARLARHYAGASFMPTPVHRLDRETSGVLLVAKTYSALRRCADAFAAHGEAVCKEYVAWVGGQCPWTEATVLHDTLGKTADAGRSGYERVAVDVTPEQGGKTASLLVRCVQQTAEASLVLIRLYTGRTHQIRAQLAARGFPLIGDVKYGGRTCSTGLKLHAARLTLFDTVYEVPPSWGGAWAVSTPLPVFETASEALAHRSRTD